MCVLRGGGDTGSPLRRFSTRSLGITSGVLAGCMGGVLADGDRVKAVVVRSWMASTGGLQVHYQDGLEKGSSLKANAIQQGLEEDVHISGAQDMETVVHRPAKRSSALLLP